MPVALGESAIVVEGGGKELGEISEPGRDNAPA